MNAEQEKITEQIKDYAEYLVKEKKLAVCLCGFYGTMQSLLIEKLSPYMFHPNAYCNKVKSSDFRYCIFQQRLVKKRAEKDPSPFFGTCFAGVREYVFPVCENGKYYGFLAISNYGSEERKTAEKFNAAEYVELYGKSLSFKIPPFPEIKTVINPLVNSLRLLALYSQSDETENADGVYLKILSYLTENATSRLTLGKIASDLHYSASYVSHVFKKYKKKSVMAFVNGLKTEKAKDLLENTDFTVTEIGFIVGFDDSDYFATAFRKIAGVSPREYRNAAKKRILRQV